MRILDTCRILCDMLKWGGLLITTPQDDHGAAECAARTLIQFDGDLITSLNKAMMENDDMIKAHFDHVSQVLVQIDEFNTLARRMLKSAGILIPLWPIVLILMEISASGKIDVTALTSRLWPHLSGSGLALTILGFGRSWVFQGIVALGSLGFAEWSERLQFPDEPTRLF